MKIIFETDWEYIIVRFFIISIIVLVVLTVFSFFYPYISRSLFLISEGI